MGKLHIEYDNARDVRVDATLAEYTNNKVATLAILAENGGVELTGDFEAFALRVATEVRKLTGTWPVEPTVPPRKPFGVTEDYDYGATHKRSKIDVWSGPFYHTREGTGFSRANGRGFIITTYNGDKVTVDCASPRTDDNYIEVDKAIDAALAAHYAKKEASR